MERASWTRWRWAVGLAILVAWLPFSIGSGVEPVPVPVSSGVYTEEQAESGRIAFAQHCVGCHGADLQGGFGPRLAPLDPFQFRDRPLSLPYAVMRTQMPFDAPGSLDDDRYAAILAYVLHRNGYPAGPGSLPADPDLWPAFVLDEPPAP